MRKNDILKRIDKRFNKDIHSHIVFSLEGLALLHESLSQDVLKPIMFYKGVRIYIGYKQKKMFICKKKS